MLPHDYNHYLFTAANVGELQQYLVQLKQAYEPSVDNQEFRILRQLERLARISKGLRVDTKYGLGSYFGHNIQRSGLMLQVLFDGDQSTVGISPSSVNTFWFEME